MSFAINNMEYKIIEYYAIIKASQGNDTQESSKQMNKEKRKIFSLNILIIFTTISKSSIKRKIATSLKKNSFTLS